MVSIFPSALFADALTSCRNWSATASTRASMRCSRSPWREATHRSRPSNRDARSCTAGNCARVAGSINSPIRLCLAAKAAKTASIRPQSVATVASPPCGGETATTSEPRSRCCAAWRTSSSLDVSAWRALVKDASAWAATRWHCASTSATRVSRAANFAAASPARRSSSVVLADASPMRVSNSAAASDMRLSRPVVLVAASANNSAVLIAASDTRLSRSVALVAASPATSPVLVAASDIRFSKSLVLVATSPKRTPRSSNLALVRVSSSPTFAAIALDRLSNPATLAARGPTSSPKRRSMSGTLRLTRAISPTEVVVSHKRRSNSGTLRLRGAISSTVVMVSPKRRSNSGTLRLTRAISPTVIMVSPKRRSILSSSVAKFKRSSTCRNLLWRGSVSASR
mmetsp:Transcript_58763/g.170026  ORF Transcript_58763/g.170026 Transcript_58763/m.170026 type:complete len:399 (+) Transcript_58763:162-1358(+)